MKKRILACFLSVMLVLAALPFSALAYGHSDTTPLPAGAYKSWKQTDPRWTDYKIGVDPWTDSAGVRHENETMGHAGCLISSMAILARGYGLTLKDGTDIDPGTLGKAMYDGGSCKYLNYKGASKYETAFNELIPGVSFHKVLFPSNPVSTIRTLLSDAEKEYIIIAAVNNGGHYVAVDCVKDGDVVICDPGYPKTLLSQYKLTCLLVYTVDESFVDTGTEIPGAPIWQVTEKDGIKIRSGAGLNYDRVGAYKLNQEIEVTETKEADGYLWGKTEKGWCALRSLDGSSVFCVCLTVTQYSITYHATGGTGAPNAQYKNAGEPINLSEAVPQKEGHLFLGWSADPSALSATYAPGAVYGVDEPLVLYAVWMAEAEIFAYGIDVSSYQKAVDWQAVADSGVSFVILRAGTSKGKDPMFEENYVAAKEAGLSVGSYFFTYALTEEEMLADAALFEEWLEGKTFELPVYVDIETEEQSKLPAGELTRLAQLFQGYMTAAGYFCGVYASYNWFGWYLDGEAFGGKEYLWMAKWSLSGTLSQNLSNDCAVYQYSETGTVPGISVTVDLNVCYMDLPAIVAAYYESLETQVLPLPDSGLTIFDEILAGGRAGMTVGEWQALFDGGVTFTDGMGNTLTADDTVCTGYTVICGDKTYTVSVKGDLDGDGKVNALDYAMVKRYVLGTYRLTREAYYAALITGDTVTALDYARIKRHVLNLQSLYE
jgi:GH25 family lysozyme M1 (1,4-beta-N-acetylmuramidase)